MASKSRASPSKENVQLLQCEVKVKSLSDGIQRCHFLCFPLTRLRTLRTFVLFQMLGKAKKWVMWDEVLATTTMSCFNYAHDQFCACACMRVVIAQPLCLNLMRMCWGGEHLQQSGALLYDAPVDLLQVSILSSTMEKSTGTWRSHSRISVLYPILTAQDRLQTTVQQTVRWIHWMCSKKCPGGHQQLHVNPENKSMPGLT